MEYNRRQFIKNGALLSFSTLIGTHLFLEKTKGNSILTNDNYLSEVRLLTSVEISKMIHFYNGALGFKIVMMSNSSCTFQTGNSLLTFIKSNIEHAPFYHFAFTIPENKIKQAEKWQLEKTNFIKPPSRLTDSKYNSDNIVHFRHWDAHSLFFYDPANNVVEYIARHTIANSAKGDFNTTDILCISEIGLVVENVYETSSQISSQLGLKKYSSSSDKFFALGDEHGLILLFGENSSAAFNKGRKRKIFNTEILVNSNYLNKTIQIEKYPYIIRSQ